MRIPCVLSFVMAWMALGQVPGPPARVEARVFPIMGWGAVPGTAERLAEMREAGFNVAGFCGVESAGEVRAAGLSCFVRDKRVTGLDWKKLPGEDELRARVKEVMGAVQGNEAVLGVYLSDEPSAELMPGLARVGQVVRELDAGAWPYVNLLPNFAIPKQMGTADYAGYLESAMKVLRPPFLSYDHYALVDGELQERFFENLDSVRKVSMEAGIPFWNCVLANAHFHFMEPTDASLRLQVYATLAYGGRGIEYFTYNTPMIGNYRAAAIDPFGNRTATWDALRRVNLELHALAPVLVKLKSTGVYGVSGAAPFGGSALLRSVATSGKGKDRFVIGEFADGAGRPYFMIVNKSLTASFMFRVELAAEGKKMLRVNNYTGQEEGMRAEMSWLGPGMGMLFRVE